MALVFSTSQPVSGCDLFTYNNLDTADTDPGFILPSGTTPAIGCIQVVGTFGGATVALQGSNNGADWLNLEDRSGDTIAITAEGGAEFSTSFVYLRPKATGGTGDDVDVFIALRG
jgi:hypothetical protein